MLEYLFDFSRILHIIAGFVALVTFWIPIVTKKGRKWHRGTGWIFTYAMAIVSVSALYMGVYRIAFDPDKSQESISFAWFLIFIAILSGATAWYGIRVLKFKRRNQGHLVPVDLIFPFLLVLSGISISIYGFVIDFPLLKYFPLLGIFLGASHLFYWLKKPKLKMHWIMEHISGMLSCSIATITAFVVFGAPRLLKVETVSIFIWFLPTIIMVPLLIGFTIYYQRKYN